MSDGLSLPSIRETRPVRPSLFKSESTEILVDNVGGLLEQSRADKDIADEEARKEKEEREQVEALQAAKKKKLRDAKKKRASQLKALMGTGQDELKAKRERYRDAKRNHGGKVEQARAKRKAEEAEARRKALLGFAAAMNEFGAISAKVKDSTDAELAALEREAQSRQLQWYKEQAITVERTLLQRDAARRSSEVMSDRLESARRISRAIGPFRIPTTLDEWDELKDKLPLHGSPAAAAFLFIIALLENNMSHKDELGNMALKDALSPRCTRDLLEHEVDEMMHGHWQGAEEYHIKRRSTLNQLDAKHYSGAAGVEVDHPKVIRTQTQKKIDHVTIRQVAKMLHAEHAEAVLSKKRQTSTRNKRMSRAQTPKAFSEAEMQCAITFNWSEARRDLASHSRGRAVTIHVDVPEEHDDFDPERGPKKPWFKLEYDAVSKRYRVHSFGCLPKNSSLRPKSGTTSNLPAIRR